MGVHVGYRSWVAISGRSLSPEYVRLNEVMDLEKPALNLTPGQSLGNVTRHHFYGYYSYSSLSASSTLLHARWPGRSLTPFFQPKNAFFYTYPPAPVTAHEGGLLANTVTPRRHFCSPHVPDLVTYVTTEPQDSPQPSSQWRDSLWSPLLLPPRTPPVWPSVGSLRHTGRKGS